MGDAIKLPEPYALDWPEEGLTKGPAALALWRLHQYDTGAEPLFTAEQMRAYATEAAEQRLREVEADARRYHVMRDKVCGSPMGHFSFVMFPALPANWRQGSIAQHFDAALDALQGTGSGSAGE